MARSKLAVGSLKKAPYINYMKEKQRKPQQRDTQGSDTGKLIGLWLLIYSLIFIIPLFSDGLSLFLDIPPNDVALIFFSSGLALMAAVRVLRARKGPINTLLIWGLFILLILIGIQSLYSVLLLRILITLLCSAILITAQLRIFIDF